MGCRKGGQRAIREGKGECSPAESYACHRGWNDFYRSSLVYSAWCRDRDTAFPIAINLATKLQNAGVEVNFKLPWNRPHSGDYALNELFS